MAAPLAFVVVDFKQIELSTEDFEEGVCLHMCTHNTKKL